LNRARRARKEKKMHGGQAILKAIERSGGNQTRAAELLGISRDQLRYRLKKLEEAEVSSPEV